MERTEGDAAQKVVSGWIQSALQEYEQIASLCNAQTLLINAVVIVSPSSSSSLLPAAGDVIIADHHNDDDDDDDLNLTVLKERLQRRNLHDQLSQYYQQIDTVRKTHAAMKSQLFIHNNISKMQDGGVALQRYPSPIIVEAMRNHLELSERVIRTVMKSSSLNAPSSASQCCGVLFENGIVKTSSSSSSILSDHEVNVVALASLRASVTRLKDLFDGK